MSKNWRPQIIITFVLILISIYYLIPTIFHFEQIRDLAEKGQKNPPSYLNFFPKEEIKLGLDLQGGIYVEMEVLLDEALKNKAELVVSDLPKILSKETFAPQKVSLQELEAHHWVINIDLKKAEDQAPFTTWMKENYRDMLQETTGAALKNTPESKPSAESQPSTGTTVHFSFKDTFFERIKEQTVQQAVESVRNRIDRYGVAEPSIVKLGANRISIELPGITDPERALNLIKRSGRLEFKLVDTSTSAGDVRKMVSVAREELKLGDNYSEENILKINEKLKDKIPEGSEILFEVNYDPTTKKIAEAVPYLLKKKVELSGEMLKNAQVSVHDNDPYVSLSFNNIGTKLFAELTKANVGKQLAIILDGNVSKAPVIQSEIPSGDAQITLGNGDYQAQLKEAQDLTLVLHEGALPARLKELTKTVVGPSLGQDSIHRGMKTVGAAAFLVALFMIIYYKTSGFFADVALLLNFIFMIASLAIFQATLTLTGIAGLVLTIGMAVDANVLIFERIKEEIQAGIKPESALEAGYGNAMSAILDSNITTFLAGVILYQFGTGSIRGFAVTLMIGIATTLFTSIIVTRILQEWFMHRGNQTRKTISV